MSGRATPPPVTSRKPRFLVRWGIALGLCLVGIIGWGLLNAVLEATNSLEFCISCHEMRDTVYEEYTSTVHYQNRTGIRASCSDCHVPRPWFSKIRRKIHAVNELYYWLTGSINTPEKFEAKRLDLATRVWESMRDNDSQECRNCHTYDAMSKETQTRTAWRRHREGSEKGETCIDCHKGIAHKDISDLYDDGTDDEPWDDES